MLPSSFDVHTVRATRKFQKYRIASLASPQATNDNALSIEIYLFLAHVEIIYICDCVLVIVHCVLCNVITISTHTILNISTYDTQVTTYACALCVLSFYV